MFTSLGISLYKLTNYVPRGVCGSDLTPSIVWTGANTNEVSITIIIDWGIAKEYNGIGFIDPILKFEVLA
jgi:hypothetical protein